MYYKIRHVTRFRYSAPITESVMEVRKQPRSDGMQRCLSFDLVVSPRVRVLHYFDHVGNVVHHFDLPSPHIRLVLTAEAIVETQPPAPLPDKLDPDTWGMIDTEVNAGDYWDWLMPSHFARTTPLLDALAHELAVVRSADPLTVLRWLNTALYQTFDYVPDSTEVDSPIDVALEKRKGVCQDFSHVMIALVRGCLRIPCRYVSGYLFHERKDSANGRNGERSSPDATHAWVEAWLPTLGWVGFDPTNNALAGERHVRVAVGRDYFDVPPTKGFFKGEATSELSVAVEVNPTDELPVETEFAPDHASSRWLLEAAREAQEDAALQAQQIQQQ